MYSFFCDLHHFFTRNRSENVCRNPLFDALFATGGQTGKSGHNEPHAMEQPPAYTHTQNDRNRRRWTQPPKTGRSGTDA